VLFAVAENARHANAANRGKMGLHLEATVRRFAIAMATLQQLIADKFLAKLAESKHVDSEKIDQLRALLANSKKPKAEDFVRIFSLPAGGDLK